MEEDAGGVFSECARDALKRKGCFDERGNTSSSSSGFSMEEDTDEDHSSESESESESEKEDKDKGPSMKEIISLELCRYIQVFSVQFVDYERNNKKLAETYGIILLQSSWRTPYVLFQRFPGDPLPIDPEGFVKLSGPSAFHHAWDRIDFFACLGELDESASESVEFMWDGVEHRCSENFNKLLSSKFDTELGPVQVDYAVLTLSAETVLEVKLLDWKDYKGKDDAIEVFGAVTAGTKLLLMSDNDRARSYMFKRDKEECALVRRGEAIPLSRCCIPLLYESSIVLEVDLRHPEEEGDDQSLICCSVEVPFAERDKAIVVDGVSARIQVKLTHILH